MLNFSSRLQTCEFYPFHFVLKFKMHFLLKAFWFFFFCFNQNHRCKHTKKKIEQFNTDTHRCTIIAEKRIENGKGVHTITRLSLSVRLSHTAPTVSSHYHFTNKTDKKLFFFRSQNNDIQCKNFIHSNHRTSSILLDWLYTEFDQSMN